MSQPVNTPLTGKPGSGKIEREEPDRICGYSVHTSAFAPKLEAGKSGIAFGDYNIANQGTRSLHQLRELFAGNGMIGYVCKERVDGLLILQEAVQKETVDTLHMPQTTPLLTVLHFRMMRHSYTLIVICLPDAIRLGLQK